MLRLLSNQPSLVDMTSACIAPIKIMLISIVLGGMLAWSSALFAQDVPVHPLPIQEAPAGVEENESIAQATDKANEAQEPEKLTTEDAPQENTEGKSNGGGKRADDWSVTTIDDPKFDIVIESEHAEIKAMLEKHLELYRYRMLSDLTALELRRLLEATEDNIRALTGTEGYFSPTIEIAVVPADQRKPKSLLPLIHIDVDPGVITKITEMELLFEGDIETQQNNVLISSQKRRLRWGWAMREEDPFTQSGWANAKSNMLTRLTSQYYAAGKIGASQASIDPESNMAKLSITLDSGPRFYLGDHSILGVERYSERLVRNFARLRKGDDFLLDELNKAQQRLSESGYFDVVYVYVRPDAPNPEEAPINVMLREAYYQQMTVGPGYSTDNGPRLTFEYRHNEVPLLGWQLVSFLEVDKDNQTGEATLRAVPDDDYWRWTARAKLQNLDRDDEKTQSVQGSYGRSFISDVVDKNYFLQYDKTRTEDLKTKEIEDVHALSANVAWTWRKFNNITMPRRGWGLNLDLGAGSTFGQTATPFIRVRSKAQIFFPMKQWRNGRFVVRGEFGGVFAKEGEPMPATLLFRTGGDNTVRGYAHRYIAVSEEGKATTSGRYMLVGSVEYQRPIILNDRPSDFDWAVFTDTGAVSNRYKDLNFYTGVGAGVRWHSPVGPLNVDLGYGLKTQQIRLHFNIGFTF